MDASEAENTQKDGTCDSAAAECDGDNETDADDAFPLDPTESEDTDNDGTGHNADTDDDGDHLTDSDDALSLHSS